MSAREQSGRLLVVAGEASGDAIAGAALRALGEESFGMGGEHTAAAGATLLCHLRTVTGTGVAARRLPRLLLAYRRLLAAARRAPPRAALLVDFTEFNARLGARLRALGVPVLWCVAPQVWAWRSTRTASLRRSMDRLAVLFSFEQPLWRRAGVDAHWVGHPALDARPTTRADARRALGIAPLERALALLPGSRPNEIHRLLPPMLGAAILLRRLKPAARAAVLLAPSLDQPARRWASARAAALSVEVLEVPAAGLSSTLVAFDASLCASGTATLESALLAVPPVIAYRLDPLSAALARRLLRIPRVGLPNVLLGQYAYPELLQGDATAEALARSAAPLLESSDRWRQLAGELRAGLDPGDGVTVGARVAALLAPWFGRRARPEALGS